MLSLSSVAFALARNAFASSAVGADDGRGGPPGALTSEQDSTAARIAAMARAGNTARMRMVVMPTL